MRTLEGVTPPEVAELISDVIKDKVVCDVGCGEGTFMEALRDNGAKQCIGIEEEEAWVVTASHKGFPVFHGSSWFQPLPTADVYYLWTRDAMGVFLKAQYEGTKGTFVFGHTVRKSLSDFLKDLGGEKRELPGTNWWVQIVELQ